MIEQVSAKNVIHRKIQPYILFLLKFKINPFSEDSLAGVQICPEFTCENNKNPVNTST